MPAPEPPEPPAALARLDPLALPRLGLDPTPAPAPALRATFASVDLNRDGDPGWERLRSRLLAWAGACPGLVKAFWTSGGRPICVGCGAVGRPLFAPADPARPAGPGRMLLSCVVRAGTPAAARVALGGGDALFAVPPAASEVWYGWCAACDRAVAEADRVDAVVARAGTIDGRN